MPIVGDAREVIEDLVAVLEAEAAHGRRPDLEAWWAWIDGVRGTYPLGYTEPPRRRGRAAAGDPADRRDRRARRPLRRRRRPAPDVGVAVRPLREAQQLDQLRRPRHDGFRRPGGDGRQGRRARQGGVGDRRRRLLPDDQPGAGHLRRQRHPDQGRGDQQQQPRDGPAVADALLPGALLEHRPAHLRGRSARAGLRQARRRLRLRRPAVRAARGRRRDDREGDVHQRRARGRRLRRAPRRDGLADGARPA